MNALDKLLLETNKLTIDILVELIKKQDKEIELLKVGLNKAQLDLDRYKIYNTRLR